MAKKTKAAQAFTQVDGTREDFSAKLIATTRIVADPDQPRKEFDPVALKQLSDSIKERGQLQPIRVRWSDALASYVVVSGERRYRAAKMADVEYLMCSVVEGEIKPAMLLEDQLVENCLRDNLKPIEQAHAFKALLEMNKCSQVVLAAKLNIDKANVTKALALLTLPEAVQAKVEAGDLAPTTAYEVSKLADPAAQEAMAEQAVTKKMTRKAVTDAVREAEPDLGRPAQRKDAEKGSTPPRHFNFDDGTVVTVRYKGEAQSSAAEYLARALKLAKKGDAAEVA